MKIPPHRLAEIRSGGSGVGIKGMQERISQFGGEMNIESSGAGTSVIVSIRIPKQAGAIEGEPAQAAV